MGHGNPDWGSGDEGRESGVAAAEMLQDEDDGVLDGAYLLHLVLRYGMVVSWLAGELRELWV